jgi:hypothetical protein
MTLEVAEALLEHAVLRREEIPAAAIDLLQAGTDTPTIRRLAGPTDSELSDAHDLFRRVPRELGRIPPATDDAAKTIAKHLASLMLVEGLNPRDVAADGAMLAPAFNYHDALMPFYRADDDHDLPGIRDRTAADRELIDYARDLLGRDPEDAV